jgi:hypothetical protein
MTSSALLAFACSETGYRGSDDVLNPGDTGASTSADVMSVEDVAPLADAGSAADDVASTEDIASTPDDVASTEDIASTPDDVASTEDIASTPDDVAVADDTGGTPDDVAAVDDTGGLADVAEPPVDGGTSPLPGLELADLNEDGTLAILVIGSSKSIAEGAPGFAPDGIAEQLQAILDADPTNTLTAQVQAEDIYTSLMLTTGYGQNGANYDFVYYRHSLMQWYHWPEGIEDRKQQLLGEGDTDWDVVVLAADPHIVADMPGYFALGANTVASKVAEGGAQPLLLVGWHPAGVAEASADYVAGVAHATSYWASVDLPVVPSAVVWDALPGGLKDVAAANPTPGGAYLAAASIYSHLSGVSASTSDYSVSDSLATAALAGVQGAAGGVSVVGLPSKVSPFSPISTSARVLHYNHTGTSSENGILNGLKWVLAKANVKLINGGSPPIEFNYGRANTEFEANKRYKIDPAQFDHSMGFPMQDHSGYGNVTMLHGLDKRRYDLENGTDLGVARYMTANAELPYARAIPIRTLFARMREVNPEQSGYSDGWHMNKNLDKAVGAYMYTLLTGHCALDAEPADPTSGAWKQWMAHKLGYETAWTLMYLRGKAPCFKVLPENVNSVSIAGTESATLSVSFGIAPTAEVTVTLASDDPSVVDISPSTLTFTPENYAQPQVVTMTGLAAASAATEFTVTAEAASIDTAFDAIAVAWTYGITP